MRQFSCSTFSQHLLMHFPITRGLRPLVIWGNASTRAVKKLNTRIASCGKATFSGFSKIPSFKFPWNSSLNELVRLQWCGSCAFYAHSSHLVVIYKVWIVGLGPKLPGRAKFDPQTLLSVIKFEGKPYLHWMASVKIVCSPLGVWAI